MTAAFSSTEFTLSFVASSLVICHYYTFTSVLPQLISPFGFDDTSFNSIAGVLFNLFGVLGGVLTALILYYNPRKLPEAALFVALATTATFIYFMTGTGQSEDKTQMLVACSAGGFCVLPILMVAYELAVEQTTLLGVGEGMSCGLINSLANSLGFVYVLVLTPILDQKTTGAAQTSMVCLLGSLVIAIVLTLLSMLARSRRM